jgi:hypothetical protein
VLRSALAGVACAVALVVSGCGGSSQGAETATPKPGEVRALSSVDDLRDAFREDAGVTRIVVLLSPT